MSLSIKSEQECRWDIASLGEVMLRLDPGEGRIHTTRSFRVCEGGGDYNVARGLRRCFRMWGAIVTASLGNGQAEWKLNVVMGAFQEQESLEQLIASSLYCANHQRLREKESAACRLRASRFVHSARHST